VRSLCWVSSLAALLVWPGRSAENQPRPGSLHNLRFDCASVPEKGMKMNASRFIVGLILMAVAVGIFLFGGGEYSTAGAVGLAVLGIVSIALARKK